MYFCGMNYNERNAHARDCRLHFDAPTHTYYVDRESDGSQLVCESVTTIVEGLFEQFDANYWAARKATPEHPAEAIKAEWEAKARRASALGTELHDRVERYYLGEEPSPEARADRAFGNFLRFASVHRLVPFRSEWRIFSERYRVAGTLDFLAGEKGRFELWDWKRSSKVVSPEGEPICEGFRGKCGVKASVAHIPDTSYWHYALQLSLYRYILETEYDIPTAVARLGVFHPDYGCPWVVEVPYLRREAKAILDSRL